MMQSLRRFAVGSPLTATIAREIPPVSARMFTTIKSGLKLETSRDTTSSCKLVYDGSCPLCSTAVTRINIKGAELINARDASDPVVRSLEEKGYNLDKGMALIDGDGTIHFGAEAIAQMGKKKGGVYEKLLGSQSIRDSYGFFRSIRDRLIPETIAEQRAREGAKAAEHTAEVKIKSP